MDPKSRKNTFDPVLKGVPIDIGRRHLNADIVNIQHSVL
jgi:hypothetical protein